MSTILQENIITAEEKTRDRKFSASKRSHTELEAEVSSRSDSGACALAPSTQRKRAKPSEIKTLYPVGTVLVGVARFFVEFYVVVSYRKSGTPIVRQLDKHVAISSSAHVVNDQAQSTTTASEMCGPVIMTTRSTLGSDLVISRKDVHGKNVHLRIWDTVPIRTENFLDV